MKRIAIEPRPDWNDAGRERSASTSTPSTASPTGTSRPTTPSPCARSRTTSKQPDARSSTTWRWRWSTRWSNREALLTTAAYPVVATGTGSATPGARREPHLYGRMDLAYDGNGPAKLYELNYDTPTSLYESGVFPVAVAGTADRRAARCRAQADQYNSIQEALVRDVRHAGPRRPHRQAGAFRRGAELGRGSRPRSATCATAPNQVGHRRPSRWRSRTSA